MVETASLHFPSFTVSVCFTFSVVVFSCPAVFVPSYTSVPISSRWTLFTTCMGLCFVLCCIFVTLCKMMCVRNSAVIYYEAACRERRVYRECSSINFA